MNELIIPPAAKADPDSFEILRVWAANGEQHVTIHSSLNGTAADFGFILAQLAINASSLYAQKTKQSREDILNDILEGFDAEIDEQTDEVDD